MVANPAHSQACQSAALASSFNMGNTMTRSSREALGAIGSPKCRLRPVQSKLSIWLMSFN